MESVKSALIFASGKVVFTGAKTKLSIDNAFIELKKKMEKFRRAP
jgi:TATA-box binding protein (TBP) (component of TFIID and TFIIIB)